jgi:pimeloyl-ACP methyl ester carboxylesterase
VRHAEPDPDHGSLADDPGAVLWLGTPDQPRVLLLHDIAMTGSTSWLGQLQLADDLCLGIVDRPGYAITDRASNAGWTSDARMLLDVLDRNGPAHLVAHGCSAAGVLLAAQLAPTLVSSIVLVEPPLFQLVEGSSLVEDIAGKLVELHDQSCLLDGEEFLREYQTTLGYLEPPRLDVPERCAEAARRETPACQAPLDLEAIAGLQIMTSVVVGGREGPEHDPGERTVFGGAVWKTSEVLVEAVDGWLVPVEPAGHAVQWRTGLFNGVLRHHIDTWWSTVDHSHAAAG